MLTGMTIVVGLQDCVGCVEHPQCVNVIGSAIIVNCHSTRPQSPPHPQHPYSLHEGLVPNRTHVASPN